MEDDQKTENASKQDQETIYLRNRKRFLKWSRLVVSLLLILLVIAGAVFFIQSKKLSEQKSLLNQELQEVNEKHQNLEKASQ